MTRAQQLIDRLGSFSHFMLDPEKAAQPYTARDSYEVVDGMAVVDISGILVNDSGWWDGWGYSGYARISAEIRGAVSDPNIEGILLRVNSPGGETDNAFETAAEISAAARQKPVWAVADVSAYSAGYLLASSASRIYGASTSGGVGSIGVYTLHLDHSKMLEKIGIEPTFISAGEGKTEGNPYQPLSDEAKASLQAEVDRLYGAFVDFVSARRRMEPNAIREMGASLKHGFADAKAAGLVDRQGNLETAMREFRGYLDGRKEATLAGSWIVLSPKGETSVRKPVASATNPQKEGISMPVTEKADAAKAPPVEATVPPSIEQQLSDARAAGRADAEEIVELCQIAGRGSLAAGFLRDQKSARDVRAALLDLRAGKPEDEIVSHVAGTTGTSTKPDGASLLKAVEALKGAK